MTSRALRIALIASLAANLFVGSALVAGAIMWQRARAAPAVALPLQTTGRLRRAAAALPDAERRALRRVLRADDATALAAAQDARAEAARLFAAEPYDPAALAAAFDRARRADLALRTGVETRLVAFAATLPPADRATLAGAMSQRSRRMRPR